MIAGRVRLSQRVRRSRYVAARNCATGLLVAENAVMAPSQPPTDRARARDNSPSPLGAALSSGHLGGLDGLRAVAVAIVIVGHSFSAAGSDLGVTLFFVLSGFLITWLLLKERNATGRTDIKRFYLARTLRIFPAYYVFLIVSIAIDLMRDDSRIIAAIIPGALYFLNYFNAFNGHPVNSISHAWSLAIEEQFYLLWPLLFILLARRGSKALLISLASAVVAVATWRSIAYLHLDLGSAYVYNAFDTRSDALAVGCLLGVASAFGSAQRWAAVLVRRAWMPLAVMAAILCLRLLTPLVYRYSVGFTVDALLFAVLIVQILQLGTTRSWNWLNSRALVFLGAISYPMYLYHQLGLGAGRLFTQTQHEIVQLVAGIALTVLAATGSYFFVEMPFLRLKRALGSRAVLIGAQRPVAREERIAGAATQ